MATCWFTLLNKKVIVMEYHFSKTLDNASFNEAIDLVTEELKKEGFGVLTEIDVQDTLKKKIDVDFKKYKILGACNPHFAYQAFQHEDKIGAFLPCNVVVEEHENGQVEVSAVDPIAMMSAIKNEKLSAMALEVQEKLQNVISRTGR